MQNSDHNTSPYAAWRDLVDSVGRECSSVEEQISPFGFELLPDRSYMFRKLSRFFIYLKAAGAAPTGLTEREFLGMLMQEGAGNDSPVTRTRVIITSEAVMVRDRGSDAYLYVRCISLPSGKSLLRTYGDYISVTPILIADNTFPELQGFEARSSARRYVCQVTLMCSELYREIGSLRHDEAAAIAHMMRVCPDRDLTTGSRREVSATRDEIALLDQVIRPLHNRWAEYLAPPGAKDVEVVPDFHGNSEFKVRLSGSRLEAASKRVMTTYLDYFSSHG